LVQLCT